jgi:hypothetical protein
MKKTAEALTLNTIITISIVICSMLIAYKQTGHCYGPVLPFDEEISPETGILIVIIFLAISVSTP